MSSYYIGCDVPPTENGAATRLQCTYSNGAIAYTEEEVSDLYAPPLTMEVATEMVAAIYLVSFVSWGLRQLHELLKPEYD